MACGCSRLLAEKSILLSFCHLGSAAVLLLKPPGLRAHACRETLHKEASSALAWLNEKVALQAQVGPALIEAPLRELVLTLLCVWMDV